eukprot:3700605-Rhodomonas_salina.1
MPFDHDEIQIIKSISLSDGSITTLQTSEGVLTVQNAVSIDFVSTDLSEEASLHVLSVTSGLNWTTSGDMAWTIARLIGPRISFVGDRIWGNAASIAGGGIVFSNIPFASGMHTMEGVKLENNVAGALGQLPHPIFSLPIVPMCSRCDTYGCSLQIVCGCIKLRSVA